MTASTPRFKAPDTTLIIFSIIVLAAILTWIIPAGAFQKAEIEVEGAGTREVVVPGSYAPIERADESVGSRLIHTVAIIFQAPILGFVDEDAAPIIAFVLLIGGAFAVLQKTGAVDAALRRLVQASQRSRAIELLLIPLFMALFSLGGAVFGMAEETIPFVLIFVPLALALGYDSLVGAAIPFLGSAAGFAAAFFNPFTVGVAQGIAQVPLFSGVGFRIVLWVITTGLMIAFVMTHAARIRRDPTKSPTYALDQKKREQGFHLNEEGSTLTGPQQSVLTIFMLGIAILVFGVLQFQWYITEIAALFIALGIVMGIVGGLGANGTARAFMEGAKDLVATALIIGIARGILVVMQDGQIIDTILYSLSSALEGAGSTVAAMSMFGVQTVINFFVPSGSGQAALTMPLMAPLSDLLGVSRQTAVLAFQMGDGFTNMIIPTSAVLMGVLTLADIPWPTWARWIFPFQLLLFFFGLMVLAVAVQIGFA
ncbi:MAG: putative basic amino acid antiporter YfcC [Rhodothermaceae bacterium]|nr:putative basic amino acid antiporter YfcC [Rhodothermaceae bacterium]